jgi:putative FmdB family regulatory protein
MPTYEYACVACGTHVEVYQKFSDEPLSECGVCGGRLRKVFHPAGILFKGSGFYATDSRAGRSKSAEAKKEAAAGTKAETKSETKPDTKPESKPESKGESKKEASA